MLRRVVLPILSCFLVLSCCPDGEDGFQVGDTALIVVTPDPISFSSVGIGDSDVIQVEIRNSLDARGDLDIESVVLRNATADLSINQPTETLLKPGESTFMQVTYSPTDELADGGELVIDYYRAKTPKVVKITTLAQVGTLTIDPNPINFGETMGGTPSVKNVKVVNNGSKSVDVGVTAMAFDGSADFQVIGVYELADGACAGYSVDTEKAPGYNLAIGDGYCVDVQYVPSNGGSDVGKLQVFPPAEPGVGQLDEIAAAQVIGVEVGPEIDFEPSAQIDFGAVGIGEEKVVQFGISNDGAQQDLIIESVTKGENLGEAFADVEVLTAVPAGTAIAPGADPLVIEVRFAPTTNHINTFNPLGYINVVSNDSDEGTAPVTVFGQVASPELQVNPPELLDFGVCALEFPKKAPLHFTNTGSVKVIISELSISKNSTADEFEILNMPALPLEIEAGGHFQLDMQFTNHGGGIGEQVWGEVAFTSNDPNAPTIEQLRAVRADTPECKIKLHPPILNYGTVSYGKKKSLIMNIENVGSAPCSWKNATLRDGVDFLGVFQACPESSPTGASANFKILSTPPGFQNGMLPGQTYPLEIMFAPEASGWFPLPDELAEISKLVAAVQIEVYDFANLVGGDPKVVKAPLPDSEGNLPCNLTGQSGKAHLEAIPGEVDFGVTTVGCHSQTVTVTLYNTGVAPLSICDIKLEGCTPEFKLKSVPPIPVCVDGNGTDGLVLKKGTPQKLEVVYAPQDLTDDGCTLAVYEGADVPSVTVPLYGSGTYDDEQTDVFTQLSGQMVDVLFVVDNSGSMGDEQDSLAANFQSFTASAQTWDTDYHIGVITTDMESNNSMAAKLMGPDDKGESDPRFVLTENVGDFKTNVKVGDWGSGTEQGLVAAQKALSAPLISMVKPLTECNDTSECPDGADCVSSVLDKGKKYCGGYNMEFLREDATLEIVFVSDEEDQSDADLNFYVDFFKSIKGFANENLFHAHAIVGKSGGCDGPGGSAADGQRYRYVAQETGGKFHNICDSNWAQKLQDIGSIAFGLKVQFFLTRPAIPGTVDVKIDGQPCNEGWEYQADVNAVKFDENGACMPQESQKIEIHYEVMCFKE